MKFKVNKVNEKRVYDEFIQVLNTCKHIQNNPYKKVTLFTTTYIRFIVIEVLFIIYSIYSMLTEPLKVDYVVLGGFSILLLFTIVIYVNGKSKINYYYNNSVDTDFKIDNDEILVSNERNSFKYKWEDIKYIVINKYSICFIPNTLPGLVLGIPISAHEDIVKMAKKYNKEELLIDNSDLYKKV